jgi:hypothetical protein
MCLGLCFTIFSFVHKLTYLIQIIVVNADTLDRLCGAIGGVIAGCGEIIAILPHGGFLFFSPAVLKGDPPSHTFGSMGVCLQNLVLFYFRILSIHFMCSEV